MSKTVNVLMSTYNGEQYLHQQIESILRQDGVEVMLTVRDDGSTDSTQDILSEYQQQGLLQWYSGDNLGPARSFLQLLQQAEKADFYAFADQDDYWQPDKLQSAVQQLGDIEDRPTLYFSQTTLADEYLKPLARQIPIQPLLTYGESLVYQFVGGCTMVMNNSLRQTVNSFSPEILYMHDVWIYCVCLAVGGSAFFDKQSHMLYRQHSRNVIGQGNRLTEWKRRLKRLRSGEHARYKTAVELRNGYADRMPMANKTLTDDFINARKSIVRRIKLMGDPRLSTSDPSTSRAFKAALLLGTY